MPEYICNPTEAEATTTMTTTFSFHSRLTFFTPRRGGSRGKKKINCETA